MFSKCVVVLLFLYTYLFTGKVVVMPGDPMECIYVVVVVVVVVAGLGWAGLGWAGLGPGWAGLGPWLWVPWSRSGSAMGYTCTCDPRLELWGGGDLGDPFSWTS